MKGKICMLIDHPILTTGFANASRPIAFGLHEAGYDVHVLGRMNPDPDLNNDFPFNIWPAHSSDKMGYRVANTMIRKVRPDIVWTMASPEFMRVFLQNKATRLLELQKDIGFVLLN